jgi:NADH-quinone oxidoreductase subunit H
MDKFENYSRQQRILILSGGVLVLALIWLAIDVIRSREPDAGEPVDPNAPVDPYAGGFPVPPMPGQTLLRSDGSGEGAPSKTISSTSSPELEEVHGG